MWFSFLSQIHNPKCSKMFAISMKVIWSLFYHTNYYYCFLWLRQTSLSTYICIFLENRYLVMLKWKYYCFSVDRRLNLFWFRYKLLQLFFSYIYHGHFFSVVDFFPFKLANVYLKKWLSYKYCIKSTIGQFLKVEQFMGELD